MTKGCLVILCLVGWLVLIAPNPAVASPDEVKWSRVSIPTEGRGGGWVLANDANIRHLTLAPDGTLYAYANPAGTSYTLFKSNDHGKSWSYTSGVSDTIVAIATAPDDGDIIYYATTSAIYKSSDGAASFSELPAPGGAGSNNIAITSIAVAPQGDGYILAAATKDSDNTEFGGVYLLDDSELIPRWQSTSLGSFDAYALAFSPNYASDYQLVAVVTDESDTFVTSKVGDGGWGVNIANATLDRDNSGASVAVAVSADIAFPTGYDALSDDQSLFIAIDSGSDSGDVYQIELANAPGSSSATDLDIGDDEGLSNIDVTSVAVSGSGASANLLGGAADSAQVYFSTDGGDSWEESAKPPTGGSQTFVLLDSNLAYAATSGSESALSLSEDFSHWNQLSLIDTEITGIVDLAPSPDYAQDNSLFLLTQDGAGSLWRSQNGGDDWQRVFSSTLPNVDSLNMVELPPRYGWGSQVVFIAGVYDGNPAIWKSKDNGQSFIYRLTHDPDSGDHFQIDAWAVVDEDTLFMGSFDGSNGLVYATSDSGWSYSDGAIAGSHSLSSIVLSPDYEQDETVLVGNTDGWVYWSDDNGVTFESLPVDATSAPSAGAISVAFDPEFSSNDMVYAASDNVDEGIYRFKVERDDKWESIDGNLPSGGKLSQLVVSADGTLYAANRKTDGGLERCLNPTYSLGPTFETVTRGLDDGVILAGLWLSDNTLWSIDSANIRLMTYTDTLTQPVTLTSPLEEASGIGIGDVKLDWETLDGAITYQWQLDYDTDLSTVPADFEASTEASFARLPELETATTYYWRVRVTEPVLSGWSEKWSFTTTLGYEASAPQLESPEAGTTSLGIKPLFQWSAIAYAEGYELMVSTDPALGNPTILKIGDYALPGTAWQSNVSLNYDTTYYWKVRAVGADTSSDWSAVSVFTTQSALPPSPPLPPPTSPQTIPESSIPASPATPELTIPHWLVYLVGGLLLSIILLLIILLVMVTTVRRA